LGAWIEKMLRRTFWLKSKQQGDRENCMMRNFTVYNIRVNIVTVIKKEE
jgi:hypothetical protein